MTGKLENRILTADQTDKLIQLHAEKVHIHHTYFANLCCTFCMCIYTHIYIYVCVCSFRHFKNMIKKNINCRNWILHKLNDITARMCICTHVLHYHSCLFSPYIYIYICMYDFILHPQSGDRALESDQLLSGYGVESSFFARAIDRSLKQRLCC